MNNEPVAWMELYYGEPNNLSWTDAELRDSGEVYKTVPLYTHPVKELTDEEINKLWAESHEDGIAMQQGFTTQQHYFVHLILRKAQEK
jgi:hypothetical protein